TVGHVCPLFEFATGFEYNRSGWENIRIRAMLLGMHPDEIEAKLPEIAEFSELGRFLDYPVRTYSTGMFVRLAFAVSTSVNPEILLLDEVMGAGDLSFTEKANVRMREFMDQGKILVFSSHSLDLLTEYCNRTVWMNRGRIIEDGPTPAVVNAYKNHALGRSTMLPESAAT
ncbi:MAG: ABC transporter ATP-binding protein, partial [Usitatibacteraceae bacterium]